MKSPHIIMRAFFLITDENHTNAACLGNIHYNLRILDALILHKN